MAIESHELRLVLRGLWPGEDRPIVIVEQLDRRRPDRAEEIVGRARDQMDLRVGILPTEIAIEAGDARRGLVAPAIVFKALRGEIEAPFPVPDAVL